MPVCAATTIRGLDSDIRESEASWVIDYHDLVDALEHEGFQVVLLPYGRATAGRVTHARKAADPRVAFVVAARTDTRWFHECSEGEIRFLRGRIRFPGERSGAPFPSAVVIFGRRPAVRFSA